MGPTTNRSDQMLFDRANLGDCESASDSKARFMTNYNHGCNVIFSTFAVQQESGWTRGEKTRTGVFLFSYENVLFGELSFEMFFNKN